jgi:hypothetical protein
MQALLERYAPSELLLGIVSGGGVLFTKLPFAVAVAVGVGATALSSWLDQYGVRRVS